MTITRPHLQFEQIADLVEGRLGDDERAEATAHTAECSRCAEQAARLERAVLMMRTDTTEEAPRYAIASAVSAFRSRVSGAESSLKRLLAALTFDSFQMESAAGLREGAIAERQLVYSAGDSTLHLQVSRSGDVWLVSGQVLGDCAGGEIEVRDASQESVKVALSGLYEFTVPPLKSGSYSLLLRLPDIEVEIPDFELGA